MKDQLNKGVIATKKLGNNLKKVYTNAAQGTRNKLKNLGSKRIKPQSQSKDGNKKKKFRIKSKKRNEKKKVISTTWEKNEVNGQYNNYPLILFNTCAIVLIIIVLKYICFLKFAYFNFHVKIIISVL